MRMLIRSLFCTQEHTDPDLIVYDRVQENLRKRCTFSFEDFKVKGKIPLKRKKLCRRAQKVCKRELMEKAGITEKLQVSDINTLQNHRYYGFIKLIIVALLDET